MHCLGLIGVTETTSDDTLLSAEGTASEDISQPMSYRARGGKFTSSKDTAKSRWPLAYTTFRHAVADRFGKI